MLISYSLFFDLSLHRVHVLFCERYKKTNMEHHEDECRIGGESNSKQDDEVIIIFIRLLSDC